jgi:hypothetical protein
VGQITITIAHKGWFHADFMLDHSKLLSCVAADRLKVGTPVSIGFHSLSRDKSLAESGYQWHTLAQLDELSILAPGEKPAFPGATVTHIRELKPSPARNTKPVAAVKSTSVQPATSTMLIHRAATTNPNPDLDELNRRMDWVEGRTGRPADLEIVLADLRRELYGPTLAELRVR